MRLNRKLFVSILLFIGTAISVAIANSISGAFTTVIYGIYDYFDIHPQTEIENVYDSNNASIVSSRSTFSDKLTIDFNGNSLVPIVQYKCSLDIEDENAFSTCKSPKSIDIGNHGEHTFYVKSIDLFGVEEDEPDPFEFYFHPSPPITQITSVIGNDGSVINNNSGTTSETITFDFAGKDNQGISTITCIFDNMITNPCINPITYDLSLGRHTFLIKSIDNQHTEEKYPKKYLIKAVPSGFVKGQIIISNTSYPSVSVIADDQSVNNRSDNADGLGHFSISNVIFEKTSHSLTVKDSKNNIEYYHDSYFDTYPSIQEVNLGSIPVDERFIQQNISSQLVKNDIDEMSPNQSNGGYKFQPEQKVLIKPVDLDYITRLVKSPNNDDSGRWDVIVSVIGAKEIMPNIEKVTYFLHPSFYPSVITLDNNKNNDYSLNLRVYGGFKIFAKVYFKEGVVDLSRLLAVK